MLKRLILPTLCAFPLLALAEAPIQPAATEAHSKIDLVIALDTSSSMDGLIDGAKLKLWDIVSTLASAKPTPDLRVALYSYGNDGYSDEGWVRKEQGFTEDLDLIYEKLNSLTTNGGTEYVARVTRAAMHELDWTPSDRALKIMFVAGNEPANQDPKFPVQEIAKAAIAKGIVVNTIYCGGPDDPDAAGWREVARAADGEFSVIDQDNGTVVVATPMDQRLAELSAELNKTYIAYGARAEESKTRQMAQDSNAAGASASTGAARAVAKASKLYKNSSWDLVDARTEADFDLAKVPTEQLPPEMQKMSQEERKAYVEKLAAERQKIQDEINKLNVERVQYIAEEKKKQGLNEDHALDKAVKASLRKAAAEKDIEIPE